jgi:hypothetical protein
MSYWFQKSHILAEAKNTGNLLLGYVNASSTYFEHSQKALVNELLGENDRFYPELTNGFMVLRELADLFHKNSRGHSFHLATLNPLNKKNMADLDEIKIIETFRSNPQLLKKEGLINRKGATTYYIASPIKVTGSSCLNCHGKPENAPRAQIVLYGMENGYNWQNNEIISAAIIYIPVLQDIREAKNVAVKVFFISFACFLLTFLAIILFFERS